MKLRTTALALAALALSASAVLAAVELTPEVKAKIEEMLKAQGYEVKKVKVEDGMYEAYVKKGDEKAEIYLNEKLEIVDTKKND